MTYYLNFMGFNLVGGQPKTIEQISYREYAVIKPYLIKEGE